MEGAMQETQAGQEALQKAVQALNE